MRKRKKRKKKVKAMEFFPSHAIIPQSLHPPRAFAPATLPRQHYPPRSNASKTRLLAQAHRRAERRTAMRRSSATPPTTWQGFWPFYLREHSLRLTRIIHVAGTVSALTLGITGLLRAWGPPGLLLSLAIGYAPAWLSHFLIEGNRPASFKRPFLSFVADLRMAALFLTGRLWPHLLAAGVKEA